MFFNYNIYKLCYFIKKKFKYAKKKNNHRHMGLLAF
jgi:hypothetical protein